MHNILKLTLKTYGKANRFGAIKETSARVICRDGPENLSTTASKLIVIHRVTHRRNALVNCVDTFDH